MSYKVLKLELKENLPGNPTLLVGANQEIKLCSGKVVKASDLLPGDLIIIKIPLLPGVDIDVETVVLSISETELTSASGLGIRWVKNWPY